jgi:hypothetical protein
MFPPTAHATGNIQSDGAHSHDATRSRNLDR